MNFQSDVIERSYQVPVVVDFWAAWCGPCRILGPVIEQLASEAQGRWELVKVDTEAHQDLAQQYQIMSIPAVKLFVKGEPVAEFAGAWPRTRIIAWLDEHLPSAAKEQLAQVRQGIAAGKVAEAVPQLKELLAQDPDFTEAAILLAALEAAEDPMEAQERVMNVPAHHPLHDQAEGVQAIAEMMMMSEDGQPKVTELVEKARAAFAQYDLEGTLTPLIEAIMIHKPYCNEMPRRAVLGFFKVLGEDHPLTKKYRPRFSMALY